jgi:hypothetical chaperone protein
LAEEKLRRAAHLAGFAEVAFLAEPLAAAAFYVEHTPRAQTLLVFDFGGGTLDLTVLQVGAAGQQQVLAAVGILVGGDDLDSAIMRGKVAPYFGTQSAVDVNFDGRLVPFPERLAEYLGQWQTIPTLTRPEHLQIIRRGIKYGNDRAAFESLELLATQNYGFALFQAIERAKRELSAVVAATIELQLAGRAPAVGLTRAEFDSLIGEQRAEVRRGIREAIAAAGLTAAQIEVVVATGGSSSIPAFQTLLRQELPRAEIVVSDIFGSVTGGLAIQAHRRHLAEA